MGIDVAAGVGIVSDLRLPAAIQGLGRSCCEPSDRRTSISAVPFHRPPRLRGKFWAMVFWFQEANFDGLQRVACSLSLPLLSSPLAWSSSDLAYDTTPVAT